ncbi:hypothetical protein ACLMJK_000804 [Lecanora helva]
MYSSMILQTLVLLYALSTTTSALGINCRGSGMCRIASWENKARVRITQVLRDAVWNSPKPNSTTYGNGDHVICVSQFQTISLTHGLTSGGDVAGAQSEQENQFSLSANIGGGGICLFPQYMADGAMLSLEQIRPLTDQVLAHGCGTCGSIPIHYVDQGSNDPSAGILTFNYVKNPDCIGNCLSANGQPWTNGTVQSSSTQFSRLRRSAKTGERIAELVES